MESKRSIDEAPRWIDTYGIIVERICREKRILNPIRSIRILLDAAA
ncbi:MAG TPA: hypothetical protein VLV18_06365 [Terriglobales bacterium]|nr:hypothetical protein [Terriglobales bacterium]